MCLAIMLLMLLGMKAAPCQLILFHAAGSAIDGRQLCGAFRFFSLLTCGATVGSTVYSGAAALKHTQRSSPHKLLDDLEYSRLYVHFCLRSLISGYTSIHIVLFRH